MSFIWTFDFWWLKFLKSTSLKENWYNLAGKRQSRETDICYAFTTWHFIAIISLEPQQPRKVPIILTVHIGNTLNNLPKFLQQVGLTAKLFLSRAWRPCLETPAWKECGGESKWGEGVNMAFHSSKKKMALSFISPHYWCCLPSIYLFSAGSCILLSLKERKCQNLQMVKGPGTGCWTSPFSSHKKILFVVCFFNAYWFIFCLMYTTSTSLYQLFCEQCV